MPPLRYLPTASTAFRAVCVVNGPIPFRALLRQDLSGHRIMQRLRYVGSMIADAFEIFADKQQMRTRRYIAWVLHHISNQFAKNDNVKIVYPFIGLPNGDRLFDIRIANCV